MREIKFDIISKHPDSDELYHQVVTLEEIEDSVPDYVDYEVVARRQYTGVQDMNGHEIYEGDILAEGQGRALVEFEYTEFLAMDFTESGGCNLMPVLDGQPVEVIGNIYDNPDLLTAVEDA